MSKDYSPLIQPQSTSMNLTKSTLVKCRSIVWVGLGISVLSITGAALIKVEQTISARGQLKPLETTAVMKLTPNTYIKEIYVKDGEQVDKGEPLLLFHSSDSQTELLQLEQRYEILQKTNQFYQQIRQNNFSTERIDSELELLKLPEEVNFSIKNRTALVANNQVLQLQLEAQEKENNLNSQQFTNLNLRVLIQDLESQINNKEKEIQERKIYLKKEKKKLTEIEFLVEQGAVPRIKYSEQEQKIKEIKAQIEQTNLQIQQTNKEIKELHFELKQAREQLNTLHEVKSQNILKQIQKKPRAN